VKDSEEVKWLDVFNDDQGRDLWAPESFDLTVIIPNPLFRVRRTDHEIEKTAESWIGFGREVGVDADSLCSGYPNPDILRSAAARVLPDISIEWPLMGCASPEVKQSLTSLLRSTQTAQSVMVGLYTGGHGALNANWLHSLPLIRSVGVLEFGFIVCQLGDFLDRWAAPVESGSPRFDPPDVSFLWPEDRTWFFQADPDSSFVTVSGNRDLVGRLLLDASLELWMADPAGPWGVHVPVKPS
jgi:hypothetical protein